jgi:hypothetical protein
MKDTLIVCLVFVLGIGIGTRVAQPAVLAAQSRSVFVARVFEGMNPNLLLSGGKVVGFSCTTGDDGKAQCFIAVE